MITVQDGLRNLKFEGELLAASSSRIKKKFRWVEFRLYRTESGRFVISRVGVSMIYHQKACSVVSRNNIAPVPSNAIGVNLVPCDDCRPDKDHDYELYPETSRYHAQILDTAEGVVSSLKKYDEFGTEYLTIVAKKLLEEASKKDNEIHSAYYEEWID